MAMEEVTRSHPDYVFCFGTQKLWRVEIPKFDQDGVPKSELKINVPVFSPDRFLIPVDVGVFISGSYLFMVGGREEVPPFKPCEDVYLFGPTSYEEGNVSGKDPYLVNYPGLSPHIVSPIVFGANAQIYFLTQYVNPWCGQYSEKTFCLKSYDPTKQEFLTHPDPPYTPGDKFTTFRVGGYLVVCGYIYLFIQENLQSFLSNDFTCTHAFSFNTNSSPPAWEERQLMKRNFTDSGIPIPFRHRGDTGVSEEVWSNTRILVALCDGMPAAYIAHLGAHGSLTPVSFRLLIANCPSDGLDQVHLLDIGSGRFCVVYQYPNLMLGVYVFKIDYGAEFAYHTNGVFPTPPPSYIICSRKFFFHIPSSCRPVFNAFCFAPHPASQSSGIQTAAAEEQDSDGKMVTEEAGTRKGNEDLSSS